MSNRSSQSNRSKNRELSAPNAAQATSEGTLGEHNLPGNNNPCRLRCLIEGEATVFPVVVAGNEDISDLKEYVHEKGKNGVFATIDAKELMLLKVNIHLRTHNKESLRQLTFHGNEAGVQELTDWEPVSYFWPGQPAGDTLHIFVKLPSAGSPVTRARSPASSERSAKRLRVEDRKTPRTPPPIGTQAAPPQNNPTPPRLKPQEIEPVMTAALEPFTQYIQYLAEGKLDGYFNSIRPEDSVTDLGVGLPTLPVLLLHDLGKYAGKGQVEKLFVQDTVHLFAVSGSGKTRLVLEGLYHNWGFYISCQGQSNGFRNNTAGSHDFETAIEIMKSMSEWNKGVEKTDIGKNVDVADRAFAMLLCARVFVLKHLLKNLPVGADAAVARQRWVLVQVLPPHVPFTGDIFSVVIQSLRSADTIAMLKLTRSMLSELKDIVGDKIFPSKQLFVVVDEAQVAAEYLKDSFRSFTTGHDMRPVLHAFYRFLWRTNIFRGVILAGTGLSMKMVKTAVGSQIAKRVITREDPIVFVEVGRFTKDGTDHEDYIRKYLPLSRSSVSDERLVERILYWFSGRYRFTASLIELLLNTQLGSRHRVLSAFAKSLTGFTITDATDLEKYEPLLGPNTINAIQYYGRLNAVDQLFQEKDRESLIQCLLDVLMRWRIGSQATSIPIDHDMHETVALGIGHLERAGPSQTLNPKINYPVYLCEPLMVLYLSSVFEENSWTRKQAWIANAFRTARNNSSLGYVFEEAALLVLLQMFGGKPRPLSDAFQCNQPWGSRKATLVSMKRTVDGVMQSSPVSWTSGSSDRFGFKANSPADVLKFLNNPDGKCFLFPDNHMGPDLLCFLQDEETKELILLALQAKISMSLNAQAWRSALDSIMPQFIYTANTKDGRVQYAPSMYPNLSKDIENVIEAMLGPAVYTPSVDQYLKKLRSSAASDQTLASRPQRQTPRYLRVIATPDDEQEQHLKAEWAGDVATLRWEAVQQYLGSTADVVGTTSPSVA